MPANEKDMKRCLLKGHNFHIINNMSKEKQTSDKQQNGNDFIADVGGCIFFNTPLIAYEKTRLKLTKDELEEFKAKPFTSDRAFFIWNKLPKDTRPELEFFMEWFYDDIHF